jgi:hypothetical protein
LLLQILYSVRSERLLVESLHGIRVISPANAAISIAAVRSPVPLAGVSS